MTDPLSSLGPLTHFFHNIDYTAIGSGISLFAFDTTAGVTELGSSSTTPLPGSLILMLTGMAILGFTALRRQNQCRQLATV
jgi:hypothetical protein